MKKNSYLLFILISCTQLEKKTINLKINQTVVKDFLSNPSTGYQWSYKVSDDQIVEVTSEFKSDKEKGDRKVGVGGKQLFKIKGLKKGKCTLELRHERSWEDNSKREPTVYEITVK